MTNQPPPPAGFKEEPLSQPPEADTWHDGGQISKRPREILPGRPTPHTVLVNPPISTAGGPKLNQVINVYSKTLIVSFKPTRTTLLTDLRELAQSIAKISARVGFLPACDEARGPPELQQLNLNIHQVMEVLNHANQYGLPIYLPWGCWGNSSVQKFTMERIPPPVKKWT